MKDSGLMVDKGLELKMMQQSEFGAGRESQSESGQRLEIHYFLARKLSVKHLCIVSKKIYISKFSTLTRTRATHYHLPICPFTYILN